MRRFRLVWLAIADRQYRELPGATRFELRFSPPIRWLLRGLGMGPTRSWVRLTPAEVRIRAGLFHVEVAVSNIASTNTTAAPWWALAGVHTDLRGRWIINGGPGRLVTLRLRGPVRGHAAGLPVSIRRIDVGIREESEFVQHLLEII